MVALLFGRTVTSIRLEADTSGTTGHVGPAHGIGRVASAFAGYPAPAFAGLGLIYAVSSGHERWGITIAAVVTCLLALVQRSWRGWLVTIILLGSGLALAQVSNLLASLALVIVAGYLLAASPRTLVDLHQYRAQNKGMITEENHSDADSLARQTHVPAIAWEDIFALVCLASVWFSLLAIKNSI